MRRQSTLFFAFMTAACLSFLTGTTYADTTITLDQPVHFTTAEGSAVVLDAGSYVVDPAEEWLRITPSGSMPVDALLIGTQVTSHQESLETPLALSAAGEKSDTHYLVLLLPDGKRFETVGSYSGIHSRGRSFLLTRQQIQAMVSAKRRAQRTEYVTPLVGGEGGNRNFNLDCGPGNVLVGVMEKHGSWLDALGVICARVNPQTGALENEFTRGTVGGQGGNANEVKCGFDHVVQGISFSAGQFINQGTLGCERWNRSDKAPRATRVLSCSENALGHCRPFGSFSGGSFNGPFTCPEGKVGKAFRGKHGIYIDSLRFVCDDWDK